MSGTAAGQLPAYAGYEHFIITSPSPMVAHVEINRPRKLNAWSRPVWLEFGRIFDQLSDDREVRVVILSGAGDRAFTAGLDVQAASQDGVTASSGGDVDVAHNAKALRATIKEFQGCVSSMERCEKPVICVLHGISLGLAIDLATSADIRICSSDARFSVKEVDIGLAADVGTLSRLPKVVGNQSWVREVCFSARDFFAPEALAVGLVSRVLEDKKAAVASAVELAALLAEKSPVAVSSTKAILLHSRDNGVEENLRFTQVWNASALQSKDFKVAMLSQLQKRKPTFEKL